MLPFSRRRALTAGAAGALALAAPAMRSSRAADAPIRIGGIMPLSGVSARLGKYVRIGAEIGVAQINAAGGVDGRKLELVLRDDRADPREAVAAARELQGAGINLFIGTPMTAIATAVGGIAQSLDIVLVTTGSVSDALSHELFQRNVFMVAGNNYMRCRAAAGVMAQRYPEVSVWGGIVPDIAIGRASWTLFSGALKSFYRDIAHKDVTLVDPIVTKYGAPDYKNQIAQLMSSPVEGLFCVLQGSDAITFYEQAKSLGLSDRLKVVVDNTVDLDLADVLKAKLPANMWGVSMSYYNAFKGQKLNDDLFAQAHAVTGEAYVSSLSCVANSGIRAVAAAVKAAGGTDTPAIINALETITFDTSIGPMRFRKEDHQALTPIDVIRMVPKSTPPGWDVPEFAHFPAEQAIHPPTPGVEMKI